MKPGLLWNILYSWVMTVWLSCSWNQTALALSDILYSNLHWGNEETLSVYIFKVYYAISRTGFKTGSFQSTPVALITLLQHQRWSYNEIFLVSTRKKMKYETSINHSEGMIRISGKSNKEKLRSLEDLAENQIEKMWW